MRVIEATSRAVLDKVYDVPSRTDEEGATWYKHLHSLHCAGDHGWAVGSGQIVHTQDAGKSWTNQIPRRLSEGIRMPERVFCIDQQTAWIIMLAHQPIDNCFYTQNGGKAWNEKRLPSLIHPNDIFFLNEQLGWIISDNGAIPADEAMIHITGDGGRNWDSHPLEIKGSARRVKFITPDTGLLIQHTTNTDRTRTICNILISRDRGYTWRVLKGFNRLITDVCGIDEDHFFVVGEGGFICRTTDGGMNWKRTYTGTHDAFNVIEFNRFGRGIAGADFGLLLTSDDSGKHWSRIETNDELDNIVGLSFVEKDRAIVATSTSILSLTFV